MNERTITKPMNARIDLINMLRSDIKSAYDNLEQSIALLKHIAALPSEKKSVDNLLKTAPENNEKKFMALCTDYLEPTAEKLNDYTNIVMESLAFSDPTDPAINLERKLAANNLSQTSPSFDQMLDSIYQTLTGVNDYAGEVTKWVASKQQDQSHASSSSGSSLSSTTSMLLGSSLTTLSSSAASSTVSTLSPTPSATSYPASTAPFTESALSTTNSTATNSSSATPQHDTSSSLSVQEGNDFADMVFDDGVFSDDGFLNLPVRSTNGK